MNTLSRIVLQNLGAPYLARPLRQMWETADLSTPLRSGRDDKVRCSCQPNLPRPNDRKKGKDQKQIPFGNDGKKGKGAAELTRQRPLYGIAERIEIKRSVVTLPIDEESRCPIDAAPDTARKVRLHALPISLLGDGSLQLR